MFQLAFCLISSWVSIYMLHHSIAYIIQKVLPWFKSTVVVIDLSNMKNPIPNIIVEEYFLRLHLNRVKLLIHMCNVLFFAMMLSICLSFLFSHILLTSQRHSKIKRGGRYLKDNTKNEVEETQQYNHKRKRRKDTKNSLQHNKSEKT